MNPPDNGPAPLNTATAVLIRTARPAGAETVCNLSRLTINRGVCALVHGQAVAVFLLTDGTVRAVGNLDPCSGASIMSRGLIGDVLGEPTVASPMYKQRFSLLDGRCFDMDDVRLRIHPAGITGDTVWVTL